jgi:hypothetical protein
MENREEQVDNPQFPISVAPAIDEIVDRSRQVFTPSV